MKKNVCEREIEGERGVVREELRESERAAGGRKREVREGRQKLMAIHQKFASDQYSIKATWSHPEVKVTHNHLLPCK